MAGRLTRLNLTRCTVKVAGRRLADSLCMGAGVVRRRRAFSMSSMFLLWSPGWNIGSVTKLEKVEKDFRGQLHSGQVNFKIDVTHLS